MKRVRSVCLSSLHGRRAGLVFALAASTLLGACSDDEGGDGRPGITPTSTLALDVPPKIAVPPCPAFAPARDFVRRTGDTLELDGRRFRAVGANLYYLQSLFAEGERGSTALLAEARRALDEVVCLQLPVVRAWGFNDSTYNSAIRQQPGVWREEGLRGLDRLVAEAKSRGLRLILALVNNHAPFGGLPAYAAWAGKQPDDFFGDAQMLGYWKEYVDLLATRVNVFTNVAYRDEPTIMAWELGNEFRCPSCRGTTRFVDTVRTLAKYAKAAFPNQLIGDGGEGHDDKPDLYPGLSNQYFVRGDEGVSYSGLVTVDELDMLSYHMYPRFWMFDLSKDVAVWINTHELLARMAGKVGYMGEFGHDPGLEIRDDVAAPIFNSWLSHLFDTRGGSMGLLWQWIPAERLGNQNDDGFGITLAQHPRSAGVLTWWEQRIR
jgi:mannan endo-1,4-beta-mannosidase